MKMGAKAEMKGERIAAEPNALNMAKANQNTIDIPMAIPIPKNVPRLPIKNEKGMAIKTMTNLDNGYAYFYFCIWHLFFLKSY